MFQCIFYVLEHGNEKIENKLKTALKMRKVVIKPENRSKNVQTGWKFVPGAFDCKKKSGSGDSIFRKYLKKKQFVGSSLEIHPDMLVLDRA